MSQHPVILFLPGLATSEENSSARIAELLAYKANLRKGTYTIEKIGSPSTDLLDGRRIVRTDTANPIPVVDIHTVEYRTNLDPIGPEIGVARRVWLNFTYVLHAGWPVIGAVKRRRNGVTAWKAAKTWRAKLQIALGVVALTFLIGTMLFSIWALLQAADVVPEVILPTSLSSAWRLGIGGVALLVLARFKSIAEQAAPFLRQMVEYTQNEMHASSATLPLAAAVDAVIEEDANRRIHLVAHSFGCLVAYDFLYPCLDLEPDLDRRHKKSIRSLVTMGCPLDVVRLYEPRYLLRKRGVRVPTLKWTNVFIPADVFGSDLPGGNQDADVDPLLDIDVTSCKFTEEELTLWTALRWKDFASHNDYWGDLKRDNCLHVVMQHTWMPEIEDLPPMAA
ncbi:hypothetical protein SAMN04489727_6384 [Amycolatopsis tolypomycina]|uniref:Alpha/beta hydrolase n=1 Tax=Amycolatopsis tolypomycina TaxID=208445 RepID=A0A1H4XV29_9PSEU|nr:hypothetical protein [Amycolatopsis tolypomycina]SED09499.1 hypothetical protein SAMN04489727_6384 [Amycolatopsis tolypomycina]